MMFPPQQNRRPPRPPQHDCEIEVKKTKSGIKTRFKGKCSKENLEYATEQARDMREGESKKFDD